MKKIIIVGSGGHANSCIEIIKLQKKFNIEGFVFLKLNTILNTKTIYQVLGTDKDLPILRKKFKNAFIGVGQIKNYETRLKLYKKLKENNYYLPIIRSPHSLVSKNTKIGEGTIIMNQVNINRNVSIGVNNIINSKALIEHDVTIGNHCHISTASIINGNVRIGNKCFVGSGAIIHNDIKIGNQCIIGAGTIIDKNISNNSIVYPYDRKKFSFKINQKSFLKKIDKSNNNKQIKLLVFLRHDCKYSLKLRDLILSTNCYATFVWSKKVGEKIPKKIYEWKCDYIFSFRSFFILPLKILNNANFAINFHPGPPNYRGSGCLNYALLNNETKYGVTCHLMSEKIDDGKILDVNFLNIYKSDNVISLLNRTHSSLHKQSFRIVKAIIKKGDNYIENQLKKNSNVKWSGALRVMKKLDSQKFVSIKNTKSDLIKKIRYLHTSDHPLILKFKNLKFNLVLEDKKNKI